MVRIRCCISLSQDSYLDNSLTFISGISPESSFVCIALDLRNSVYTENVEKSGHLISLM